MVVSSCTYHTVTHLLPATSDQQQSSGTPNYRHRFLRITSPGINQPQCVFLTFHTSWTMALGACKASRAGALSPGSKPPFLKVPFPGGSMSQKRGETLLPSSSREARAKVSDLTLSWYHGNSLTAGPEGQLCQVSTSLRVLTPNCKKFSAERNHSRQERH